jgi:hypothetical protein
MNTDNKLPFNVFRAIADFVTAEEKLNYNFIKKINTSAINISSVIKNSLEWKRYEYSIRNAILCGFSKEVLMLIY